MTRTVTALRVGGFVVAGIGVAALDIGFPVDFFHLNSYQQAACAAIVVGVVAQIVSFVGSAKRPSEDEL